MFCPKCGTVSADDAQVCASCGQVLSAPAPVASVQFKTSRAAIAAFVLGILSLFTCGLTALPAVIVGIIALASISRSGGRLTGRGFAIIGIVSPLLSVVVVVIPGLNNIRGFAGTVKQKAQLANIDAAIELFSNENGGYPPSEAMDSTGLPYCGAMKLAEALMGQDLLGFDSRSTFRRDGMDTTGTISLYVDPAVRTTPPRESNLLARKGPYLQLESANACRMESIYGANNVAPFLPKTLVLCDVFARQTVSRQKLGMPILYYKANTANNLHDPSATPTRTDSKGNIYNYWDNQELIGLGKPWESRRMSPRDMANPVTFYRITRDDHISTVARPFRPDSYILISAGRDGEYGTTDDVFNFAGASP